MLAFLRVIHVSVAIYPGWPFITDRSYAPFAVSTKSAAQTTAIRTNSFICDEIPSLDSGALRCGFYALYRGWLLLCYPPLFLCSHSSGLHVHQLSPSGRSQQPYHQTKLRHSNHTRSMPRQHTATPHRHCPGRVEVCA